MRLGPGCIPFPFSRLYVMAVARQSLFRGLYLEVAREVSAELPQGRVLDAGCGPGDLAMRLAGLAPSLQVWGVDISKDMIRLARKRAAATAAADRLHFERADVACLPFAAASFDACVSTIALHHWRRPWLALSALYQVLRPGGFALIRDIDRNASGAAIRAAARRHGAAVRLIHLARLIESFPSQESLRRLLAESPFPTFSVERCGVFLRARLEK
ncbi:MAG: class I SAM-dependent methyltransferase [Pseudomonadota bacterium]